MECHRQMKSAVGILGETHQRAHRGILDHGPGFSGGIVDRSVIASGIRLGEQQFRTRTTLLQPGLQRVSQFHIQQTIGRLDRSGTTTLGRGFGGKKCFHGERMERPIESRGFEQPRNLTFPIAPPHGVFT